MTCNNRILPINVIAVKSPSPKELDDVFCMRSRVFFRSRDGGENHAAIVALTCDFMEAAIVKVPPANRENRLEVGVLALHSYVQALISAQFSIGVARPFTRIGSLTPVMDIARLALGGARFLLTFRSTGKIRIWIKRFQCKRSLVNGSEPVVDMGAQRRVHPIFKNIVSIVHIPMAITRPICEVAQIDGVVSTWRV